MNESTKEFEQTQYLTFQLAQEQYAVGILQVKEIIPYGILTKVPQTPQSIRGVINLRGNVVPVVDLALKFGLTASPVTDRSCIVIVETELGQERVVMGIVADSVSQVTELPPQDIMPAPAFGTDIHIDFLRGMAKSGQKFLLILDIDKVLSNHDTPGSANSANHASDGPPDKEEVHSATCEIVSNSNEGARS